MGVKAQNGEGNAILQMGHQNKYQKSTAEPADEVDLLSSSPATFS